VVDVESLRVGAAGLALRAVAGRKRPVPLATVLALRRFAGGRDPFLPEPAHETWSIGADGLAFIDQTLRDVAAERVLELGCGDSTLTIARTLADLHADGGGSLLSIEQNEPFAEACRVRVSAAGLTARIVVAALVPHPTPGGEKLSYELVPELLDGFAPDLIVIDGPSGGRWVRYPVLPLLQRCLPRPARFLLHDGLRDYELQTAAAWRRHDGIRVDGVHVVDEGFIVGSVRPR
jgi:hypothetical protein